MLRAAHSRRSAKRRLARSLICLGARTSPSMKTAVVLVIASLVGGACVATVSSSPTPTVGPPATVASSPTASPLPTSVRGSALVPPIVSRAQYGDMSITLDIPDGPGQPAEEVVWHVDP